VASTSIQPSLTQVLEKKQLWSEDHKTARLLTIRIGEMIAVDMQPFSMVEDEGFRRVMQASVPQYNVPSRKQFSETVIPHLYDRVQSSIRKLIDNEDALCFTADIWTAQQSNKSYIGLTCHLVNLAFERKMAVLNCRPFEGSHTGLQIADSFQAMLELWGIAKNRCHLVISDSAANMVKAFRDLGIPRVACFVNSLQLVIKEGLLAQRAIIDACSVA